MANSLLLIPEAFSIAAAGIGGAAAGIGCWNTAVYREVDVPGYLCQCMIVALRLTQESGVRTDLD